jgi:hypothetical protein
MKKILFTTLIFLIALTCLIAQGSVKNNPANPVGLKNQKSIRDLQLTKVMEIMDGQEDFFFKKPRYIKISLKGDVFIYDENHLYQFDSKGKYIKDFFVKGEGPGELNYFSNFFLRDNTIIMGGIMPSKVIIKNISDGSLISEFKIVKAKTFGTLLNTIKNNFYFTYTDNINFGKIKTGIQNASNKFMFADSKGAVTEQKLSFSTRSTLIKIASKKSVMISINAITRLLTSFAPDNTLYLAHTERYMINQIDFLNQKIIRKFKRKYKPVDYIKPKKDNKTKNPESLYKRKYFNDVLLLKTYKDKLLVFTSTIDAKRGILVDVYNKQGDYIDRFYLNLPGLDHQEILSKRPVTFQDGYLWTSFKDEDDNPIIAKYRIDSI